MLGFWNQVNNQKYMMQLSCCFADCDLSVLQLIVDATRCVSGVQPWRVYSVFGLRRPSGETGLRLFHLPVPWQQHLLWVLCKRLSPYASNLYTKKWCVLCQAHSILCFPTSPLLAVSEWGFIIPLIQQKSEADIQLVAVGWSAASPLDATKSYALNF